MTKGLHVLFCFLVKSSLWPFAYSFVAPSRHIFIVTQKFTSLCLTLDTQPRSWLVFWFIFGYYVPFEWLSFNKLQYKKVYSFMFKETCDWRIFFSLKSKAQPCLPTLRVVLTLQVWMLNNGCSLAHETCCMCVKWWYPRSLRNACVEGKRISSRATMNRIGDLMKNGNQIKKVQALVCLLDVRSVSHPTLESHSVHVSNHGTPANEQLPKHFQCVN